MNQKLKKILAPLASLKLTVVLLALGMVLIFAGTTVQNEMGIWDVQRRFFHSWFALVEWRFLVPLWEWGNKNIPGAIPFPGGYTLIVLLLANLIAAHSVRFKVSWKRSGILLIHSGLILLIAGEIVTAESANEGQMLIDVGGSSNFIQDIREPELAIIDQSPADYDNEIIVPLGRLTRGGIIQHSKLPFTIQIDQYFPNSDLLEPMHGGASKDSRATAGAGVGWTLVPQPKVTGVDADQVDRPAAYVTLQAPGQSIGTYLVGVAIGQPQAIRLPEKQFAIELRFKREYKPYTVHLLQFTHDRYQGTNVPKNFASRVRLIDSANNVDRETVIWMNHPLRYAGQTFYQAGFDKLADRYSILQVVRNPGWLIPYISCSMVGLGLLIHFGMHLMQFLSRVRDGKIPISIPSPGTPGEGQGEGSRSSRQKNPLPNPLPAYRARGKERASLLPACAIATACAIYLLAVAFPMGADPAVDLFARVPVSYQGRTMPLDSLARNSLRVISGRSQARINDSKMPAIDWLLDVFADPSKTASYRIFRIDHPDILGLLDLSDSRKLFSFDEILAKRKALGEQYDLANHVPDKKRDLYQRKIVELVQHLMLFDSLAFKQSLYVCPPIDSPDWRTLGQALETAPPESPPREAGAAAFVQIIDSKMQNDLPQFLSANIAYRELLKQKLPDLTRKLDLEVIFNHFEPFYQCMILYVIVFILAAFSWLKWQGPLSRAALAVLTLALVVHTFGLVARVYLQGRPPVTNLYSSAVFIAWGAVLFCVMLELIYKNGIASAAAAAVAFPSLVIAHYLAGDGDTMKMLQAVLDTNIWLATHVVVVTLGYTATFLAGVLGITYILGGVTTKAMTPDIRATLGRMIYGVVCFAMLFSFVGTILGGIWADQSWGRFWGWDPKENGAVLVVLWNAIILHSRWGGLVRDRGMAALAVGGNIVTAWSWFGTNMLGIGLHSYGFMDSALAWLVAFAALQLAIIGLACLPVELWRSSAAAPGFAVQSKSKSPAKLAH